jgi:hypothetical protein
MSLPSLYKLATDYQCLEQLATDEELDEQALEAVRNTIEGLQHDIEVKATNVASYCLNLEAYAEAAAQASKELAARAKRFERRAARMREYLRLQMNAAGIKKIDGPQFTLTRKLNPPAVVIEPDAKIPAQYLQDRAPLIDQVLAAVREIPRNVEELLEETPPQLIAEDYLLVKPEELATIIEQQLPARSADKKKLGEALKVHAALCAQFVREGKEAPPFPVAGCRLEQAERLDIRP